MEKEAKDKLGSLISGDLAAFVGLKRLQIEEEVNEIYTKLHPNEPMPTGTINLIVRDPEDRLVKATGEHFLPKVSYASQQFSFRSPSDHVAQWAPARTLLGAIAEHGRRAVSKKDQLRGHEIPERELLEAMNVCDDHILRARYDSKIVHAAKKELRSLEDILTDDSDDRSKCERILRLIEGPEQTSAESALGVVISGGAVRTGTADGAYLNPITVEALGRISPQLLKQELATSLARVLDQYSQAGQELVDNAELGDNVYLEDLLSQAEASDPVLLANELVLANPKFDLKNLPKLPPLEPLKAFLAMLANLDR